MPVESITLRPIQKGRALLACFAHPDDESFGPGGGVFARYGRAAVNTHLVREAGQQCAALLEGAQANAFDRHARMLPRAMVPRNRCPARGRIEQ